MSHTAKHLWFHTPDEDPSILDSYEGPLGEVIHQQVLTYWHEDRNEDGTSPAVMYWIVTEGYIAATIVRDAIDADVAHVTYNDGTVEHYRVTYMLGADGMYQSTDIKEI